MTGARRAERRGPEDAEEPSTPEGGARQRQSDADEGDGDGGSTMTADNAPKPGPTDNDSSETEGTTDAASGEENVPEIDGAGEWSAICLRCASSCVLYGILCEKHHRG